ncbi:50S ribosomal protein L10 [Candidatus Woesearchaeota archaeon]|nr:50S ribosomal protein L10 [Candidatus Woesearchaeota archaeon]
MVSDKKIKRVQELTKDIQSYPIIGVVNMENLPGEQLQKMRGILRSRGIKLTMARKNLIMRAIQESKRENITHLIEKLKGMPALIFTKDNPFSLYSFIQKNKSEASGKPGQIAPHDIVVKAGPTNFTPGPIISELAAVGIKTKVEAGKLAVISDTRIAKEGDVISQKLSDTLKKLDIKPMEIGMNLVSVWENGLAFDAKQLHIDEAEYTQNFTQAAQWAFNLALECAYPTSETTELLLQKAFTEAKALSIEQNIMADATAGDILAKAERAALELRKEGNIDCAVEAKLPEAHPKQGRVTHEEAKQLLDELKEKGTLRDHKA